MNALIFEGIATSGKSSLIKLIKEKSEHILNIQVFGEEQTHEPIMKDTTSSHVEFFNSLLSKIDKNAQLVIFDRLYLTQAHRAGIGLDDYVQIENELMALPTSIIFLKVDENSIKERVYEAAKHRQTSWADYITTKGKSLDDVADYYIKQQRSQLELIKKSRLPYKIFDTTDHQYPKIAEELLKTIT